MVFFSEKARDCGILVWLGAAAGQGWALAARRFADASGAVRWLLVAAAALALVWRLARKKGKNGAAP